MLRSNDVGQVSTLLDRREKLAFQLAAIEYSCRPAVILGGGGPYSVTIVRGEERQAFFTGLVEVLKAEIAAVDAALVELGVEYVAP